jgi:hypothetical protein
MNPKPVEYAYVSLSVLLPELILELVPDLATESFLLAFRRFTSRCGNPKTIISDLSGASKLVSY